MAVAQYTGHEPHLQALRDSVARVDTDIAGARKPTGTAAPDAATAAQIREKRDALNAAVARLRAGG